MKWNYYQSHYCCFFTILSIESLIQSLLAKWDLGRKEFFFSNLIMREKKIWTFYALLLKITQKEIKREREERTSMLSNRSIRRYSFTVTIWILWRILWTDQQMFIRGGHFLHDEESDWITILLTKVVERNFVRLIAGDDA